MTEFWYSVRTHNVGSRHPSLLIIADRAFVDSLKGEIDKERIRREIMEASSLYDGAKEKGFHLECRFEGNWLAGLDARGGPRFGLDLKKERDNVQAGEGEAEYFSHNAFHPTQRGLLLDAFSIWAEAIEGLRLCERG